MNVPKFLKALVAIGVASSLSSTSADAQLGTTGLNCNNGSANSAMGAVSCVGAFAGNDMNQQSAVLAQIKSGFGAYTGGGAWWSYATGVTASGSTSGTISLGQRITGYFAVAIKANNAFSVYLFNGGTAGVTSVSFVTRGVSLNASDIAQDISHATLYKVDGVGVVATPEPASIVLLGTGLLGVIALARRRRMI